VLLHSADGAPLLGKLALHPGDGPGIAMGSAAVTTKPIVNQTGGGLPFGDQLVPLTRATTAPADAMLAPYVCDTARGAPGAR
jgi:hypothetical protein